MASYIRPVAWVTVCTVLLALHIGECTTPTRLRGRCISIYECDSILNYFKQRILTWEEREFLRKSQCTGATSGRQPFVCCPGNGAKPVVAPTPVPSPAEQPSTTAAPAPSNDAALQDQLKLGIKVYDHNRCREKYATKNSNITTNQICAGGEFAKDSCHGDSGGPLMKLQKVWYLEGIVSYGNRCGLEDWPGIYSHVPAYMAWVIECCPLLLLLLIDLTCIAHGQESCRTPDHRDGVCQPVQQCPSIRDEFFNSDRVLSEDEIDYLRRLQCKTKDVTICCPDGHSGIKKKAQFPVFAQEECDKKWKNIEIIEQQLCAGGVFGIDSCSGDSGGPLMVRRFYWIQEGIMPFVVLLLLVTGCALEVLSPVAYGASIDTEERPVWDSVRLCDIPNESSPGECLPPADCAAYGKINDVASLSSVERFSFIKQIQCNGSETVPYVCCPRNSEVYREPYVKETMVPKNRVASRIAFDADSCGIQSYVAKIRGGQLAEIDEFPWMAMLLYERENNALTQGCGGALISHTYVITAAHCVTGKNFEQTKGRLKLPTSNSTRLLSPVKDNLGPDVLSPIKLKLSLPYVDRDKCSKTFRPWSFSLGPGQMCAGGERAKDTCAGDSGSPLMSYDMRRGIWYITGIVSLGVRGCGVEGLPGVYTNVHYYLPWIRMYTAA
uniref:CLIP domain-containing serine protease n=1 Tax=Anopheles epiroticus TaxID=199890 RepID=A0A182PAD4_9DIPT